ncbi:hypothetical protein GCM10009655_02710 [Rhodoglobus aureus]|uniref:Uncharacterized protein n=1 Tax=Rhodoglobus aureus TaxID=191497 RepID=A0ABP4FZ30_9MICO
MIRQVTMDVAIADPTETARHDLVVDPPVGDQVRDDQAKEGHAATTPQVVQLAASQHPVPTDPGGPNPKATTAGLAAMVRHQVTTANLATAPTVAMTAHLDVTTTAVTTAHRVAILRATAKGVRSVQATARAGHHGLATGMTGRHAQTTAPTAETAQVAPSAAIARLVRSVTTAPVARNAEDVPTAVQVAAMGPPRNVCGPRAVHPRAETTTLANASLKKIVTPSASVRCVHSTRHPRFLRASPRRCLTASPPMS